MKDRFILVVLVILAGLGSVYPAAADFNNRLGMYGLDRNAEYTEINQVNDYSFMIPGSGIVQVWHDTPYDTLVNEYYSWDGEQINIRYYCTNSFFTTTCNFHASDGSHSSDTNQSWISLGLLPMQIDTSIINDDNGTIYFGVGKGFEFDNFFGMGSPALITFSDVQYKPILSMYGTSSKLIDMTFLTLEINSYTDYVSSTDLNATYRDQQKEDTVTTIQSLVMDIAAIIDNLIAYPYLIFAYLEIFALMFSLRSKNMQQWWKKYIKIHSDMIEFVFNNASLVIASLVVAVGISTLASWLGL